MVHQKYISTENIYKVKNVDNEEIWIDIPDYVNLYKISSYGRILSLAKQGFDGRFLTEKILKCSNDKNGYKLVFLYKNGKKKVFKVHRLIAILFIENNKNLPCVNHRDNDKKNNHVKNLEWVNDKMNKAHAISLNLMPKGESVFGSKLNKEDVIKIRNLYYQNKLSQQNIADMFNIQPTTVSGIIRGRIWRHI